MALKKPAKLTTKKTEAIKQASVAPSVIKTPIPKKVSKVVKKQSPKKPKMALSSFDELKRKQEEIDALTKQAKEQLKKKYEEKMKEAESMKKQYFDFFKENIDEVKIVPKLGVKRGFAKKESPKKVKIGIVVPITKEEVESFIRQMEDGIDVSNIKLKGRREKSLIRIKSAYEKAEKKDPETILGLIES